MLKSNFIFLIEAAPTCRSVSNRTEEKNICSVITNGTALTYTVPKRAEEMEFARLEYFFASTGRIFSSVTIGCNFGNFRELGFINDIETGINT